MSGRKIVILAVLLGIGIWLVCLRFAGGATPLARGPIYLLILAAAGFGVALVEGQVSWRSLAGLYVGQLIGLAIGTLYAAREHWGKIPDFMVKLLASSIYGIVATVRTIVSGLDAVLSYRGLGDAPLGWQPLFIASFMLAAVLGGAVGAMAVDVARRRRRGLGAEGMLGGGAAAERGDEADEARGGTGKAS